MVHLIHSFSPPGDVFSYDAITIPDGSTVGGKTSGTMHITDIDDMPFPATHDLLESRLSSVPGMKTAYMYSNAVWLQADTGFSHDIITCRALYVDGMAISVIFIANGYFITHNLGLFSPI